MAFPSLPVRGAWIEISVLRRLVRPLVASLPVRGAWIEILSEWQALDAARSLPVRGAWIEIDKKEQRRAGKAGRSPCGERGLKLHKKRAVLQGKRRSPCGERGLKSFVDVAPF